MSKRQCYGVRICYELYLSSKIRNRHVPDMTNKLLIITCSAIALSLSACQPVVANRGNVIDADILDGIKIGSSTREEVATQMGTPTAVSGFDENVWYYIGIQTEQYSFMTPQVKKHEAVEINFDDSGIVTSKKKLDLSKAASVDSVDRTTPTFGQEQTLLKELLGNLSNPRPDLGNKSRDGGTQ